MYIHPRISPRHFQTYLPSPKGWRGGKLIFVQFFRNEKWKILRRAELSSNNNNFHKSWQTVKKTSRKQFGLWRMMVTRKKPQPNLTVPGLRVKRWYNSLNIKFRSLIMSQLLPLDEINLPDNISFNFFFTNLIRLTVYNYDLFFSSLICLQNITIYMYIIFPTHFGTPNSR